MLLNYIIPKISLMFTKRHICKTSQLFWDVIKYPEINLEYLCNPKNTDEIQQNINSRKGIGDINLVLNLKKVLSEVTLGDTNYDNIKNEFYTELLKIPNETHPSVTKLGQDASVINKIGEKKVFDFTPREFNEISKRLNLVRTDQLGNVAGNRSYYLLGEMADLEQALIQYTVSSLLKHDYELVCVPDILHRDIIEACGLNTRGERNQVYNLDSKMYGPDLCLSGTSEMALASLYMNEIVDEKDLPIKLTAVSRCYRAETSSVAEERGIYRLYEKER